MKAIYTTSHGRVFQINQDPAVPSVLFDADSGATAKISSDPRGRTVTETFTISTLDQPNPKSNREMVQNMCAYLRSHKITHIDVIQNRYKIFIDYSSMYDGHPLGNATLTRDVIGIDGVIPLGVAVNNEDVFRHAKQFKSDIKFTITNTLPYGIMSEGKMTFKMQINDIAIFEDFSPKKCDYHQSTYQTPYGYNDYTTYENLQNMQCIYSSKAAGIRFQTINLTFVPREVVISTDIILSNYIDIYNKAEIDKILEDNMRKKYPPHPHVPHDHHYPRRMFPERDKHKPADGDDNPRGRDGYYDYYTRCRKTNPNALRVVENNIPDELFDNNTMIHQWKVYRDIPDIRVGEYVLFVQGFLDRPRPPRPPFPPHPPRPWPPYGENEDGEGNEGTDGGDDTTGDDTGDDTTDPTVDPDDSTYDDTSDTGSQYDDLVDLFDDDDLENAPIVEIPIEEV